MRVRFYKNTSTKRWWSAKLPIRQRLYWLGPMFMLVQLGRRGE